MKLVFARMDVEPAIKVPMTRAFNIIQRKLGLRWRRAAVILLFDEIPNDVKAHAPDAGGCCEFTSASDGFIRVWLRPADINTMLKAFCHEMTHVKQFVKRKLRYDYDSCKVKWRGTDYSSQSHLAQMNYKVYRNQLPWEQEADKMENKLFPLVKVPTTGNDQQAEAVNKMHQAIRNCCYGFIKDVKAVSSSP